MTPDREKETDGEHQDLDGTGLRAWTNVRLVLRDAIRAGTLVVRDGRIAGVHTGHCSLPEGTRISDGGGRYLAPGLIDIHVHGGGGFDLMSNDPDQIRAYARWVAARGVTSVLVSTSGRDHADILRRLRSIAPAMGSQSGSARVLGVHLEGPYINAVRRGAFPSAWLRPPNADEYRELVDATGGHVRQMTLAPELPDARQLIEAVVASGATAAIGHSDATYEQAVDAFALGVTHATHCFNAMRPFRHRDPGLVGAILNAPNVTAELIGDGAHVDYDAARVLLRMKGTDGVVLITDGMPMAGTPDGASMWEGQAIRVEGGKAVRVADGTIIGGVITLDQTMRNAVQHLGIHLHDSVAMASTNAARAIGLDDEYGALRAGLAADFILLDDALAVTETWIGGVRAAA